MCGIAGFFDLESREKRPDGARIAARQIATLRYRGPDAFGVHAGPGYAFGHARLSIIDTSPGANQPMRDGAGDTVIVFNGEIYNFAEIRAELIDKGVRLQTRSDTEAILEGYRIWGVDVVQRLRGMFAIAIYDGPNDRLVLMRDRIGKKPLCFALLGGTLVFASEVKGVLAFPGMERRVDLEAIHDYLTFQYVPQPNSAFQGVRKLPPAHVAVVERGGAMRIERYWSLPEPRHAKPRPEPELREELVAQLSEATRLRLVSDVPIGAFLSGGVDSSAVVAMMARESASPVRTFTIGFDEASHDERPYARAVAERYATRHQELTVRADAGALLDDLVYHYDEPFADSSAIPTYLVSKIAREHVTVVLCGDGGDENFLGYTRYLAARGHDLLERVPAPVRAGARWLASAMPGSFDRFGGMRHLRRAAETLLASRGRRYAPYVAYLPDAAKHQLYAGAFRERLTRSSLDRLEPYLDAAPTMAGGAAWADVHTYLPDGLLVKMDIASMANSLEARAPFLDHKLMEWAAGIPAGQRFRGREPKSLLKRAMEPYLPKDLLYRPKRGFAVPIDRWLRAELSDLVHDTLMGPAARARGLFDPAAVARLIADHNSGHAYGYRLWVLLMLELWHRAWIDPADPFETETARRIIARHNAAAGADGVRPLV